MISILISLTCALLVLVASAAVFGYFWRRLRLRQTDLDSDGTCRQLTTADRELSRLGIEPQNLPPQWRLQLANRLLIREQGRLAIEATMFSLLLAAAMGLAMFNVTRLPNSALYPGDVVEVSVGAGEPQSLSVPPEGLTLVLALSAVRAAPLNEEESSRLVAIRRSASERRSLLLFIPLAMALGGSPGDLPLQVRDVVRVIPLEETSLGLLESTEPGVPFAVSGCVERPGQYATARVSEPIMNISTDEYVGTFARDGSLAEVIILDRQSSSSGLLERYIIPLTGPFLNRTLLEARIAANDRYTYARMSEIVLFQPLRPTGFVPGDTK